MEVRTKEWRRLRRDPYYLPTGAKGKLEALSDAYGHNRQIQRERKEWMATKGDIPAPLLQALGMAPTNDDFERLDRQIRYQLSGQWFFELSEAITASAGVVLLGPNLDVAKMFGGGAGPHLDWFRFWLEDVQLSTMATERVIALVEQFQLRKPIDIGNSVDQIHAGYLLQSDCFVTADRELDAVVRAVHEVTRPLARPVLVNRKAGESALAELRRVLG